MAEAFEDIARLLLQQEGYWSLQGYKFRLSAAAIKSFEARNFPRVEIDIVAFKYPENEVIAVEARNFIDDGVSISDIKRSSEKPTGDPYARFTCKGWGEAVLQELRDDLVHRSFLPKDWNGRMRLGLIVSAVQVKSREPLRALCAKKEWLYWDTTDVAQRIRALAKTQYENDPVVITAKIMALDQRLQAADAKRAP